MDLPVRVLDDIITLAKRHGAERVVLFGSRARGTNTERSDIDLAVWGGDAVRFSLDVDDEARTLLEFDVVDMNTPVSDELRSEIAKDGVVLYEKV